MLHSTTLFSLPYGTAFGEAGLFLLTSLYMGEQFKECEDLFKLMILSAFSQTGASCLVGLPEASSPQEHTLTASLRKAAEGSVLMKMQNVKPMMLMLFWTRNLSAWGTDSIHTLK